MDNGVQYKDVAIAADPFKTHTANHHFRALLMSGALGDRRVVETTFSLMKRRYDKNPNSRVTESVGEKKLSMR